MHQLKYIYQELTEISLHNSKKRNLTSSNSSKKKLTSSTYEEMERLDIQFCSHFHFHWSPTPLNPIFHVVKLAMVSDTC